MRWCSESVATKWRRGNDVVADNASACAFVIGAWMPPSTNVEGRAVTLEIDGAVVASGNTADILDHPLQALCNLARLAARADRPVMAGALVLAGSEVATDTGLDDGYCQRRRALLVCACKSCLRWDSPNPGDAPCSTTAQMPPPRWPTD